MGNQCNAGKFCALRRNLHSVQKIWAMPRFSGYGRSTGSEADRRQAIQKDYIIAWKHHPADLSVWDDQMCLIKIIRTDGLRKEESRQGHSAKKHFVRIGQGVADIGWADSAKWDGLA